MNTTDEVNNSILQKQEMQGEKKVSETVDVNESNLEASSYECQRTKYECNYKRVSVMVESEVEVYAFKLVLEKKVTNCSLKHSDSRKLRALQYCQRWKYMTIVAKYACQKKKCKSQRIQCKSQPSLWLYYCQINLCFENFVSSWVRESICGRVPFQCLRNRVQWKIGCVTVLVVV